MGKTQIGRYLGINYFCDKPVIYNIVELCQYFDKIKKYTKARGLSKCKLTI